MKPSASLRLQSWLVCAALALVAQVQAQQYLWSPLAGASGGAGYADATGTAALLSSPSGVAVDAAGNSYVADTGNNVIRKVTLDGVVTTLAGSLIAGHADGQGAAASFNHPQGIAADASGNLYVADTGSHTIRKITTAGLVSTLAGTPGVSGSADGTGAAAGFNTPSGVAVTAAGIVFVADTANHTIRQITSDGAVTTLAGTAGVSGSTNSTGAAASFSSPSGVAVNSLGRVFVADTGNHSVRQILNGAVTTLAGSAGTSGTADGTGAAASFMSPAGIAVEPTGYAYVTDKGARTLRRVGGDGSVTTIAGFSTNAAASVDGVDRGASFAGPSGVALGQGFMLVADAGGQTLRIVQPSATAFPGSLPAHYAVTTLAGSAVSASTLGNATAIGCDSSSRLVLADKGANIIRAISPEGSVYALAGNGDAGSDDGTGTFTRFKQPSGIAVTSGGTVFVADTGNFTIRKITTGGVVTTLAGSPGLSGTADGTGAAARFGLPTSLAADGSNNVYVADNGNFSIRKVTSAGVVTTVAVIGSRMGGLAVDGSGNIYVALPDNATVNLVVPGGGMSVYAGTAGSPGSVDGTSAQARLGSPTSVALDHSGAVLVADALNHTLRKINGGNRSVSTIGGQAGRAGSQPGLGTQALFSSPTALGIGPYDNLFVIHAGGASIVAGSTAPVVTLQTPVDNGTTSADIHGTVLANGNNGTVYIDFGPTPAYGYNTLLGTFHGVDAPDQPAVPYNLTRFNVGLSGSIHCRLRTLGTNGLTSSTPDVIFSTGGPAAPDFANASYDGVTLPVPGVVQGGPVLLQSDGRMVQTAGSTDSFFAGRWNVDGTPDLSYGQRGVMMDLAAHISPYTSVVGAALQSDDRLVMTGSTSLGLVTARYNTDGTPDTSFGSSGTGKVPLVVNASGTGTCVAVQPDGNILVGGQAYSPTIGSHFLLVRYLPDGTLDPAFGASGGGINITAVGSSSAASAILLQPDGRILVAGIAWIGGPGPRGALVRYNADGTLDDSFATHGMITYYGGGDTYFTSLALAADGHILVGGRYVVSGKDHSLLMNFTATGGYDDAYSISSTLSPPPLEQDRIFGMVSQVGGSFVAVGESFDGVNTSGLVARRTSVREADYSFNTFYPLVLPPVAGIKRSFTSVLLDKDNRIVTGGTLTDSAGMSRLGLLRLKGDSPALIVEDSTQFLVSSTTTETLPPTLPGQSSKLDLTIVNRGPLPLALTRIIISGPDAGDFAYHLSPLGTEPAQVLGSGVAATLTVSFRPHQAGQKQALLAIYSSDPLVPGFYVPLIGANYQAGFVQEGMSVVEGATTVRIPVRLSSPAASAFSIPLGFNEDPLLNDFTPVSYSVNFAAGATTAFAEVRIQNDNADNGERVVTITLGPPSNPAVSLGQKTFALTIEDDDNPVEIVAQSVAFVGLGYHSGLTDTVSGSQPLRMSWKHDGVVIPGANTDTVDFNPPTLADAGTYTLSVSNHHPGISATTQVVIMDIDNHVVRADKGGRALITANVAGRGLTYQWLLNGKQISNSVKYSGTSSRSLSIRGVTPAEAGDYTCFVICQQQELSTGKYTLQVPARAPATQAPGFPQGVVFNAYSYQLPYDAGTGGVQAPGRFICTGLPPGLVCNVATGLITGRPTKTGVFFPAVTLVNSFGSGDTLAGTLTIQAFPAAFTGVHEALFETQDPGSLSVDEGRLDVFVTAAGAYAGTVKYRGLVRPFSGILTTSPGSGVGGVPTNAEAGLFFPLGGAGSLTLFIDMVVSSTYMGGTATIEGSGIFSTLNGWRNTWSAVGNPATARLGLHAFDLAPSDVSLPSIPLGHGFGSVTVTNSGVITMTGRTADGFTFVNSGILGPAGEVLMLQPLAAGRDMLYGNFAIQDDAGHTIDNSLQWSKGPASPRDYPTFSNVELTMNGGLYVSASSVLGITGPANAALSFADGGLSASAVNPDAQVRITPPGGVSFPALNPGKASLSITPATGAFSGHFTLKDGNAVRTVAYQGQLVPGLGKGVGYFLLPQLADPKAEPPTTATTSPILSGSVMLEVK